jgi:predicted ArsR family transcriptional regulator
MGKPKRVREPIQVYLTASERAELDRAARGLGVSRSEALRRGIQALGARGAAGPYERLAGTLPLTPPLASPGVPPRGRPVARLRKLLGELRADRDAR